MNRRVLVVVGAVAALILVAVVAVVALRGGGGFPPGADAEPTATATPGRTADDDTTGTGGSGAEDADTDPEPTSGVYVAYSEDAIARAEGRILLFFHAPWCPQCRSIEADIETDGVPAGVTVIKVDYDSRQDLRTRYGVTLQTTFVEVDAAGEPLQSHIAYDEPRLHAVVDAML